MTALFVPRGGRAFPDADLSHLPGPKAPPVIGHSLALLGDARGMMRQAQDRYGPVFRLHTLGRWRACLMGADALEWVLTDRTGLFSSEQGWEVLHEIFSGGLMLRDGEQHRADRRILQAAFRAEAMRGYLEILRTALPEALGEWPVGRRFAGYPAIKRLTLDLGARVFMGLAPGAETEAMNRAFTAEVRGTLGLVRVPLPLTALRRGMAARARLRTRLAALIEARRAGGGADFFSQIVQARQDGAGWSDREIIDQFNFLMMAAHDTTASTLTAMIEALCRHETWQDRVRAELAALPEHGLDTPDRIAAAPVTLRVMDEALRLVPPAPILPRRLTRAATFAGHTLPAGTPVLLGPALVHRDPRYWRDPDHFDPDRFHPDRAEHLGHRFAHAPFGGGAHKCIGMHFARLQSVAVLHALLTRWRVEPADRGRGTHWHQVPIPRPRDGLPIRLRPL